MQQIRRGDIFYIESGGYQAVGSEQRPGRPAIVVSNDMNNEYSSTVEVVYMTTQPKRDLPTHVPIHSLNRDSIAICEQITTVAVERIGNFRGSVTADEMDAIEQAILVSLDIELLEAELVKDEPPVPDSRLAAAEARCTVLQQMYDSLLDRLVKDG